MSDAALLDFTREGLTLLVTLVALPVGAGVVSGLAISIIQTATQIQEQTLSFAVRSTAVIATLLVAGAWMGAEVRSFATHAFQLIAEVAR